MDLQGISLFISFVSGHVSEVWTEDKAAKITSYGLLCDAGDTQACVTLGTLYREGSELVQDYKKAAVLYDRACADENAQGCTELGKLYSKGDGVEVDAQKAVALYKTACDGGYADACLKPDFLKTEELLD